MTESLDDMIRFDLHDRGVRDERVLDAFRRVDRKRFVPEMALDRAYDDRALNLTHGQTLSQPFMVGLMTQALELGLQVAGLFASPGPGTLHQGGL